MNQNHTFRKSIVIGLAVLGMAAGLGASAQTATPDGRHGHAMSQEQRQAKWAEHKAKRQAKLHDALHLTAAQEPAWNNFVGAMQPPARPAQAARSDWKNLPAPQRAELAIERAKQRNAFMESRLGALKTFYAALTPEQQKAFDQASAHGHGRGHHGQMRRG